MDHGVHSVRRRTCRSSRRRAVDQVAGLMQVAWSDLEDILSASPHNKVFATQLRLSQQARGLQSDDPRQWRLFAASTLLSGMISETTA